MRNGFTLVEVLLALTVLGFVAAAAHSAVGAFLRRFDSLTTDVGHRNAADLALILMERDVRSAFVSSEREWTGFAGRPGAAGDRIDFSRSDGDQPFAVVGYVLRPAENGSFELWRRVNEQPTDLLIGGRETFLCGAVTGLSFRYSDGATWKDAWGWDAGRERPTSGIRGLPLLVEARISLASAPPVVRVMPVMVSALNRNVE